MKAIITVGVSGSGKSTWSRSMMSEYTEGSNFVDINRDFYRWAYAGKNGWKTYKFTQESEAYVTVRCEQKLFDAAFEGKDVIVSDTNLNPKFRNKLVAQLKQYGYEVEIKEFPISFQEACRRDKERGIYSVGEVVLMKQWEMWVKYHEDKQQGAW